ncbi:DNA end-binding protein Ku [Stackebrandtia endophytica]|uniref:Non-homologous end joining protein Ku n=1 Tax=Stackebrandtia endophytica TaxID=1496996 RepID=A0A543B3U4_9ACTN|nr:Ku protein [Stackebrandtia endophytica]TQL79507.1 DNA end-binding protein Ku [Stackebrandtia endophytica]
MRAIWSGAVSFGLVSIAVKAYSATEDKDVRFHQIHRTDGGRVRYRKVCELDGEEVESADIAKGYPLSSGETVILEQSDFDNLPLPSAHTIEVLEFVPEEQIDSVRYSKAYYLEPKEATKPYILLRDALTDSGVVAVVKVAMRQREQLATLRRYQDVLVLNTMKWPDEIRSPSFDSLNDEVSISDKEMEMAKSLIDSMTTEEFDDSEFHDDYRIALNKLIDAKIAGDETFSPEETEPKAEVIDLMSALQASVKRAKASRGDESRPPRKKAAKKSTKKSAKKSSSSSHRKAS